MYLFKKIYLEPKVKLSYISSLKPVFYILDLIFKMQKRSLWKELHCRTAYSTWLLPRARLVSLLNSGIPNISGNATDLPASHYRQAVGTGEGAMASGTLVSLLLSAEVVHRYLNVASNTLKGKGSDFNQMVAYFLLTDESFQMFYS